MNYINVLRSRYQLGEHNLWCTYSGERCSMFSELISVGLSKQLFICPHRSR